MKKIFIFIVLLCTQISLYSQNQAANWNFGYGAAMEFNLASGTIDVSDGSLLSTNEGCASISNNLGELLFYTDGTFVYNRLNNIMQNGTGLFGDSSSTQSALIVPKPDDEDIYYIFTVDNAIDGNNFGLNYSIVDMSLDGGLGAVTTKNVNLLPLCSEKISAVLKDCETDSIWVIAFGAQNGAGNIFNTYHAFEVSDSGVNTTAVTSNFPLSISEPRGYLKLSPDGTKMVSANMGSGLFLYDFDVDTGTASNQQTLFINSTSNSAYGVEFSPNSQYLYVHASNDVVGGAASSHQSSLVQFDTNATNIQASQIILDQRQLYRGGLQLGPDGRIYRALSATYDNGLPFLGVIMSPNNAGVEANYMHNAIDLSPNLSSQGLPPFIQSIFNTQVDIIRNDISTTNLQLCEGESYTLMADDIPGATYIWTYEGNPLPDDDFDVVVTQSGHYEVFIDQNDGDCDIEGQAFVNYYGIPVANPADDMVGCDTTDTTQFDFTSQNEQILGTQNPLEFHVHYYPTLEDANARTNEIIGPYNNVSNPQEIFARVESSGYAECHDITSFFIEVFIIPEIVELNDMVVCDEDFSGNSMDGFVTTDLNALIAGIMGEQDATDYSVSFHNSQADAEADSNPLPDNYTNTTAYNQEIYVRVENNLNEECYVTGAFNLTVNDAPVANDSVIIQCDEDDIDDGLTIFNLNQITDDITGGEMDRQVDYFLNVDDAMMASNPIDPASFENTTNPQTIIALVTNTITGCENMAEILLNISSTSANNASISVCDYDGMEDGFFQFDLTEVNDDILMGLPDGLDLTYYETYEDALLENNPLDTNFINNTVYSQIIFARVENANACYGISEVQLNVFELPNVEVEAEDIYCLNFFPETITLDAGLIDDSPENYQFLWSTGETTYEIMVNAPGVYTVMVTNSDGCIKERTVTVNPSNIATVENINITDASENNTVTVIVSGEGDYEYSLDNETGQYQLSNVFENVFPGLHTVYIRDRNGCGISEELISVIGFPKYFTPNNDGYHDYWQVYGVSEQFQPNTLIYIFDRYGKLLKMLDPLGIGWDGTFNGNKLPSSDYWFSVTLEDGRTFKSHFTLKR